MKKKTKKTDDGSVQIFTTVAESVRDKINLAAKENRRSRANMIRVILEDWAFTFNPKTQ